MPHTIRKYIDLIRQASGKWSNWDPPFPVFVGDYGTFNENGELTVEGNVYDDAFQEYLREKGFNVNLDFEHHPPEAVEISESRVISSSGVRKEQVDEDDPHVNVPGIASSPVKGTWKFPSNKRGALMILYRPLHTRISEVVLKKLLDDRLLEGKYLVTGTYACPAYLMYLSNKTGESLSVAFRVKPAGLGAVSLKGWWTDKQSDMLRTACHPTATYYFKPLFSLQRIGERPWSAWKKDEDAGDYVWLEVYPTWKPLDNDGDEWEED